MAGQSLVTEIEGRQLIMTNLDKVLYPDGMTKGQVIDYYVRIAPVMLPHLAGRNITMKRYPNGIDGQSFYNKNIPSHAPDWIERVELHDNTYIVCRDLPTLVWMANLAALELHGPPTTAGTPTGSCSISIPVPGRGSLNAAMWR